jgi:hypothetical protein
VRIRAIARILMAGGHATGLSVRAGTKGTVSIVPGGPMTISTPNNPTTTDGAASDDSRWAESLNRVQKPIL